MSRLMRLHAFRRTVVHFVGAWPVWFSLWVAVGVLPSISAAAVERGTLPGGTPVRVTLTSRNLDDRTPRPGTRRVALSGEIGIGTAVPEARTLIYAIDASGSTANRAGVGCPEHTPEDPESKADEIIDCEIAAAIRLNEVAARSRRSVAQVALVAFAAKTIVADLSPGRGDDALVPPWADRNRNDVLDVTEALRSIQVARGSGEASGFTRFTTKRNSGPVNTDFAEAIQAVLHLARSVYHRGARVAFLSDGAADTGKKVSSVLRRAPPGVVFETFAVRRESSCGANPHALGSLAEIAQRSGGSCFDVQDPSDLPIRVLSVFRGRVEALDLTLGGRPAEVGRSLRINPRLPRSGPAVMRYRAVVPVAKRPRICATVTGRDRGGPGGVRACVIPKGGIDGGTGTARRHHRPSQPRFLRQNRRGTPSSGGRKPVGISIAAIGVVAPVQPVNVDHEQRLRVPSDPAKAGWYAGGPAPGEAGALVVVGHVDSSEGPGVFHRLRQLRPGAKVTLTTSDGRRVAYRVDRVARHSKRRFPTAEVYGPTASAVLRIVTCGGRFDPATKQYLDNIVVYASAARRTVTARPLSPPFTPRIW